MSETDTLKFRLELLEKERDEIAKTLNKLAKSSVEMSADIRILIKEQMHLTQALRGIASFQMEVKQMHSTQSRLFGRVERIENSISVLRDDFHVYKAHQDGKFGALKWLAENWQFTLVLAAIFGYCAWFVARLAHG